jgi:NAD(P)-dependent dehydrogenase (short-subunit alcohol dehydrogenase family)
VPVTLITGCSSGFGLLAAVRFARGGHHVVATMRDPGRSGDLDRAAAEAGVDVEVAALDVTDDASVSSAVAGVLERHGRIDVLVNNAGVGIHGAVEDVPLQDVGTVFDTNLFGVLRMVKAVLPSMREQRSGVVVNVSSLAGRVAAPFSGVYAASKYALEAVSEALHYELSVFGVRVALVEPGGFPTSFDVNRRQAGDGADSPYRDLETRWDEAYARLPGRDGPPADPRLVVEVIHQVATDPGAPLRRLVGADAELIGELRRQLDDGEFELTVRRSLDFWDGWPADRER